jgi:putative ABC transport system substrate-binding protein
MTSRHWLAISALAGALALFGVPGAAQTAKDRTYRVAVLALSLVSVEVTRRDTLPVLAKHGFVEGRNLALDFRHGTAAELASLMRTILATRPDAILAIGSDALVAAHAATRDIPIVGFGPDPVRLGLARGLARPGGNVTGITILATELDGKRLHLLHEAVPKVRRVAALLRPGSPNREASERDMRKVADSAGFALLPSYAAGPAEYPAVFEAMRRAGAEALAIVADPQFYRDTTDLVARAGAARLATICQWSEMAAAGCLLSYGPNLAASRRRVGDYVAQILNGIKPADLPIEQPARFEMVVNLKTARALGLTIPSSILARADEVIE